MAEESSSDAEEEPGSSTDSSDDDNDKPEEVGAKTDEAAPPALARVKAMPAEESDPLGPSVIPVVKGTAPVQAKGLYADLYDDDFVDAEQDRSFFWSGSKAGPFLPADRQKQDDLSWRIAPRRSWKGGKGNQNKQYWYGKSWQEQDWRGNGRGTKRDRPQEGHESTTPQEELERRAKRAARFGIVEEKSGGAAPAAPAPPAPQVDEEELAKRAKRVARFAT
jgi:hypothetical protein